MYLQARLREGGLKALEPLRITHSRHGKYSNLILFKYDQINSPMSDAVVQDARGAILDENENWKIIAFPFRKFFNYNESNAVKIDWDASTRVFEKLDGSLMILYFYHGEWHISSSGKPDAAGWCYSASRHKAAAALGDDADEEEDAADDEDIEKDGNEGESSMGERISYKDVFWGCWKSKGYPLPDEADQNKCFMFELVTNNNRVVCHYDQEGIYLHGARDLSTMEELPTDPFLTKYGWQLPPTFKFDSLEAVIEGAKRVNAIKFEGYVVVDKHFNRVKVKSPTYVQIALLRTKDTEGINEKRMLAIIQQGEGDEFLSYFPQWTELYNTTKAKFDSVVQQLDASWNAVKDLEYPSKFVKAVNECPVWQRSSLFLLQKKTHATAYDCMCQHRDALRLIQTVALPKQN